MAYTDPWDEAAPLGSAAANTLDTIVQNLKRSLRERLEDAFPDWADDAVDPKRVVIHNGTLAARPPVLDSNVGELYLVTSGPGAGDVYIFDGTDWIGFNVGLVYSQYQDANGPGAKVTEEVTGSQFIAALVQGTTDANGDILVDSGEFATPFSWTNAIVVVQVEETSTLVSQAVLRSRGSSILRIRFHTTTGTAYASLGITFNLLIALKVNG